MCMQLRNRVQYSTKTVCVCRTGAQEPVPAAQLCVLRGAMSLPPEPGGRDEAGGEGEAPAERRPPPAARPHHVPWTCVQTNNLWAKGSPYSPFVPVVFV